MGQIILLLDLTQKTAEWRDKTAKGYILVLSNTRF